MTYFNPVSSTGQSFSIKYDNLNLVFILYIFISGLIAISAMVLPGISGSTILLIFGLYAPILNGVNEILKLNFEYLQGVIIFGFGVILVVLLTIRMVRCMISYYILFMLY